MVDWSSTVSRRAVLAGATVTLSGVAGCSAISSDDDSPAPAAAESPLDRILLRSDTGEREPVRVTLVYSPPEKRTERPVWKTVEASGDGDTTAIAQALDTGDGAYHLTAVSERHGSSGVVSFNSLARESDTRLQFEVVVEDTGSIWVNQNQAGESISIP